MSNTGFIGVRRQTEVYCEVKRTYIVSFYGKKYLGCFPDTEEGIKEAAKKHDTALIADLLKKLNYKDSIIKYINHQQRINPGAFSLPLISKTT